MSHSDDDRRDFHLDCFSGLAGDMFLGACLDLGMPLSVLHETVTALGLAGVSVDVRRAARGGLAGTRFRVLQDGEPVEGADPEESEEPGAAGRSEGRGSSHEDPHHHHPHDDPGHHHHHDHDHRHGPSRHLPEIRRLVEEAPLPPEVRETALLLFARLGEAEARAHGIPVDEVHFHEVGAVDSIVDLVGAAAAYHHLAPRRLTCGRVNLGGGTVATAHGRLPVPAPATAWLVRGLPVYGSADAHGELLTPTGAVILAELVDEFGDLPAVEVEAVGYGLGKKHLAGQPNAVRLLRGRRLEGDRDDAAGTAAGVVGRVVVLEAQVDDLPAEGFGFVMERLLAEGALDVFFTPAQMKKNRPGTLVTVLGRPADRERLAALLLAESGSLGCRYREESRLEAVRETSAVSTPWGDVRIKWARLGERTLGGSPEHDDCRRLALEHHVPWRDVYRAALAAAGAGRPSGR